MEQSQEQKPQDLIDSMLEKVRAAAIDAYRAELRKKVEVEKIEYQKMKPYEEWGKGKRAGAIEACNFILSLLDNQQTTEK